MIETGFQATFFNFIGKAGDNVSVGFFIVEILVVISPDMGLFGGIWGREGCIRQVGGSRIYFLLASLQLFKETE